MASKKAIVRSAVRKASKSAKSKTKGPVDPSQGLQAIMNQNQQLPVVGSMSSQYPLSAQSTTGASPSPMGNGSGSVMNQQPMGMGGPGKKFKNVRKAAKC